eukprot:TRINITY_DN3605_c2_g1_i1.p1 TRINITY_DN3605_c2_g1~~TRINITY_DN3605_c2_g1_i1.p1  ORF type:complete len:661 (+),score=169.13 TRINITY_DN3605_c2_g1_i1:80-2062(+)
MVSPRAGATAAAAALLAGARGAAPPADGCGAHSAGQACAADPLACTSISTACVPDCPRRGAATCPPDYCEWLPQTGACMWRCSGAPLSPIPVCNAAPACAVSRGACRTACEALEGRALCTARAADGCEWDPAGSGVCRDDCASAATQADCEARPSCGFERGACAVSCERLQQQFLCASHLCKWIRGRCLGPPGAGGGDDGWFSWWYVLLVVLVAGAAGILLFVFRGSRQNAAAARRRSKGLRQVVLQCKEGEAVGWELDGDLRVQGCGKGSAAARAGVPRGAQVRSVNGRAVASPEELQAAVAAGGGRLKVVLAVKPPRCAAAAEGDAADDDAGAVGALRRARGVAGGEGEESEEWGGSEDSGDPPPLTPIPRLEAPTPTEAPSSERDPAGSVGPASSGPKFLPDLRPDPGYREAYVGGATAEEDHFIPVEEDIVGFDDEEESSLSAAQTSSRSSSTVSGGRRTPDGAPPALDAGAAAAAPPPPWAAGSAPSGPAPGPWGAPHGAGAWASPPSAGPGPAPGGVSRYMVNGVEHVVHGTPPQETPPAAAAQHDSAPAMTEMIVMSLLAQQQPFSVHPPPPQQPPPPQWVSPLQGAPYGAAEEAIRLAADVRMCRLRLAAAQHGLPRPRADPLGSMSAAGSRSGSEEPPGSAASSPRICAPY